ncbi:MAG: glucose-1-phosphate adenylyltransferase [Christensenella hongkongensis]|uniref:glucose-1-phosphate adenylyltransferase n=1 Tax=Christensenella hongkongensis TaxID=270498 RepID=UPI002A74A8EB|nr:glucose-1-phosphate adenylyltransferase [Christensenella hongkongensis]MDY3004862.1 glucose-1-phosphate adenylyltransferase [Christensenella hongkongensis]
MFKKRKCVAMLLAGGQGSRLGVLTKHRAKPAVTYGGKYRIIDFPLSNCVHSGIDTVGVLTQYEPLELNAYIGTGAPWDLDGITGGAFVLPPYVKGERGEWYTGTANAIYQNIYFIEQYNPDYILVLSGDHIYKMDYSQMISAHEANKADATIAVIEVPMEEASRFGIMNADETLRINEFEEKPKKPKSNMASMGVYVFSWQKIREYLVADSKDEKSSNDFGKNIIPKMLDNGERLFAYPYKGYWKDVGTINSLWDANMELLHDSPGLNLYDDAWRIFSRNPNKPPHFVDQNAKIKNCLISEGCYIYGEVENSILSAGVTIEKDAFVKDSIIMQDTMIKKGGRVLKSIVDEEAVIEENAVVGGEKEITVIGSKAVIKSGAQVGEGDSVPAKRTIKAAKGGV